MARRDRRGGGPMGGLILIVVGVVFLLHSLLPGVKLWPLLLIAIGVVWVAAHYSRRSKEQ